MDPRKKARWALKLPIAIATLVFCLEVLHDELALALAITAVVVVAGELPGVVILWVAALMPEHTLYDVLGTALVVTFVEMQLGSLIRRYRTRSHEADPLGPPSQTRP